MSDLLKFALEYHNRGLATVPIGNGRKAPIVKEWETKRLTEDDLKYWFSNGHNVTGIGVVTGKLSDNLANLDFDGENWKVALGTFSDCWEDLISAPIKTGSGRRHQWVRLPDMPADFTNAKFKRDGGRQIIELRGNRSNNLVPPSLHPSGGRYEWLTDACEIPTASFKALYHWLESWSDIPPTRPKAQQLELSTAEGPQEYTPLPRRTLEFLSLGANEGDRNTELFEAAKQYQASGRPLELAIANLKPVALGCGLDEKEIEPTIKSGYKAAAKKEFTPIPNDPIAVVQLPEKIYTGATWAEMDKLIGPIEWAWPGWLPIGLLTMIVSESGSGKSAMALKITSCFLRGDNWPDGAKFTGQIGNVLWAEAEAAQAVNLARAKKWGLPVEKILSPLTNPLDDIQLDNPDHQSALLSVARRDDIRFIVIDSLSGGTRKDGKKANEMMILVKLLAEIARDTGKPVLLTHHLRKRGLLDGDKISLDRVRDSSAIVQPARVIWALDMPDPMQEDTKRLSVIKSNIARFPNPIGLIVNETGLTFGDAPEPPKKETLQDKAADLLVSLLSKGTVPATKLQQEFEQAGISWHAANRAKEKLGVTSARMDGIWRWSLPGEGITNTQ